MKTQEMSLNKIKLGKNSRLNVKTSELESLMQSIKNIGMLEPIGVTKVKTGFEVCYGNRRFLAASKLGHSKIQVIIHNDIKQSDKDVMNLAENIQRRNISVGEAGRYFSLLLKQDLSIGEIAVKLGVTSAYVRLCVTAFEEVPKAYRNKIHSSIPGKPSTPGDISYSVGRRILSARRKHDLSRPQMAKLFKSACHDDNFDQVEIDNYAHKIKQGVQDYVKKTIKHKTLRFNAVLTEREYDKLYIKHIDNGPFTSMRELVVAILTGKKAVHIKTLK